MTAAVCFPSFPASRDAARRLGRALALSAAAHLLLVESLAVETALRVAQAVAPARLTVRIEPSAEAEADGLPMTPPAPPHAKIRERPRGIERAHTAASAMPGAEAGLALPQAPDPTYYSARDLDIYPRPVAPLEPDFLTRGREHAAAIFRFQVLIDERGAVSEVSAVEGEPSSLRDELRALLAATRFHPGRKDGRAVKSRVTLGIDFDAARRDSPAR